MIKVILSAMCVAMVAYSALAKDVKGAKGNVVPEKFKVEFDTTKGKFQVEANKKWAPKGVERFYEMVKGGFFKDIGFFRVVPGFMVQFGIHSDPKISKKWADNKILDDKVIKSNKEGYVSFATSGPNSRTTQLFINYGDSSFLDPQGFSPFAKVLGDGMKVVRSINSEYREKPVQQMIQSKGNVYLKKAFPKLDYIKSAKIVK